MEQATSELVSRLDRAVSEGDTDTIVRRVKAVLEEMASAGRLGLPERCRAAHPDHYARRLLHRSESHDYTAVVMTWGPGQKTPLHDHGGTWCVECVVEGRIDVTRYDLVESHGERARFAVTDVLHAEVGAAGCLIPPSEYHVMANALPSETSVTLHVYGGEIRRCSTYEPLDADWYLRGERILTYDDAAPVR